MRCLSASRCEVGAKPGAMGLQFAQGGSHGDEGQGRWQGQQEGRAEEPEGEAPGQEEQQGPEARTDLGEIGESAMSREEIERLDRQGLAAWDSHDPDAFVSMFADDFVWFDWTVPEPMRDREAARQYFNGWVTAFPDMKTTSVSRVVGDDAVATEIEWSGTNTGPMVMGGNQI